MTVPFKTIESVMLKMQFKKISIQLYEKTIFIILIKPLIPFFLYLTKNNLSFSKHLYFYVFDEPTNFKIIKSSEFTHSIVSLSK